MIRALLFDLDDTLLGNDLGTFIPAYFQALVRHLGLQGAEAERFLTALVGGTRAMRASADPGRAMRAAFEAHFYPALGWDPAAWSPRFDEFYRIAFPRLQRFTQARPAARAVLEWAVGAGYQVVIATSPLFPLAAVRERLRWAGVDDFPFALVASYETNHFSKPHPEYFAEILARLGLRPHEALLVGNDWNDDLVPAQALGLPHYWIAEPEAAPPAASAAPLGRGTLADFLAWAQAELADLAVPAAPAAALPHLLAGDLAALLGAAEGLPEAPWTRRPAPGEWSLAEIACHLRDVEREVHQLRLQAVIQSENPFIAGADTDPWAVERDYLSQPGPRALLDFSAARRETIALLSALPAPAWDRPARHAIFGPTRLAEIVDWMLDHDRLHLAQWVSTRDAVEATPSSLTV